MERLRLNIKEVEDLGMLLKNKHKIDLTNRSIMGLKYSIEDYCFKNRLIKKSELENIINEGRRKFVDLKFSLQPKSTEVFRTPSTWVSLKNEILQKFVSSKDAVRILICGAGNAFELISMNILLNEMGLKDKVKIDVLDIDKGLVDRFEEERITEKDVNTALNNFEKLELGTKLASYIDQSIVKSVKFKSEVKSYDQFFERTYGLGTEVGEYDIVFARDILLYYDRRTHEKLLRWFMYHLAYGSYLILGVRDSVHWTTSRGSLKLIDSEGMIYKNNRR